MKIISSYLTKLQGLPELHKKIILFVVVGLLAAILGVFWFRGLINRIDTISNVGGVMSFPTLSKEQTSVPPTETSENQQPVTPSN